MWRSLLLARDLILEGLKWKIGNGQSIMVARKLKKVDEAEHSWAQVDKRMWNKLWKLDIPPKVSNFVWRACLDILLTCANLFRRTIPIDSKCVICGQAKEMTDGRETDGQGARNLGNGDMVHMERQESCLL
uniref:Reverse transcriptase zinc-binding domain-containing protein n=1 Tax=Quercus lobata TaxID=97700 RepID=A0A7N2LPY4_QUELO